MTGILLVDPRTGRRRALTRFHGSVFGYSWSPNSTQIAYARRGHDAGRSPATTILVVNADGSGERPLVTAQQGPEVNALHPAWSPDGRHVAYAGTHVVSGGLLGNRALGPLSSSDLYLVDVADGISHPLTRSPVEGVKSPGVGWALHGGRTVAGCSSIGDAPADERGRQLRAAVHSHDDRGRCGSASGRDAEPAALG